MRTVKKVERPIPQHLTNSSSHPLNPSTPQLLNIYIHFPFCRSKCAYCALHSSVGRSPRDRQDYVARIVHDLEALFSHPQSPNPSLPHSSNPPITQSPNHPIPQSPNISTLYFGGGTPALCDLQPILDFLSPHLTPSTLNPRPSTEFTVELNPLDVTPELLHQLKAGGVNRLSMGVQSFDDDVLRSMGRPHTAAQAHDAWKMIRDAGFDNAGIDLICGWPGERAVAIADSWKRTLETTMGLAPDHCSVYTLILEPKTRLALDVEHGRVQLPSDDIALSELTAAERALAAIGLERYEISSFAEPGKECRHNLATWRGEDYIGIGDGACSREGNAVSRVIFRLRLLKEGFSPTKAAEDFPELAPRVSEWCATLDRYVAEGLLTSHPLTPSTPQPLNPSTANPPILQSPNHPITYRLTPRGTEVCDTILAELV